MRWALLAIIMLLVIAHCSQQRGGAPDHGHIGQPMTLKYGDVVNFKLSSTPVYLDVCGLTQSCPDNGLYDVQTTTSTRGYADKKSSSWIIVKNNTGGSMGETIHYGDTVQIKNLSGKGSYLDVCGHSESCKDSWNVQTHVSPTRSTKGTGLWKIVNPVDAVSRAALTHDGEALFESIYAPGFYVVACGQSYCSAGRYNVALRRTSSTSTTKNNTVSLEYLHQRGRWTVQRQVKPEDEEAAIRCCLGTNTIGCTGKLVCPHILSTLGTATPEAADAIYNSDIYKKSPYLQSKMDMDMTEKCTGEWAEEGICDCFRVVDAANRIPGYNPICHNLRCASGMAYKTRNMEKIKCPGTNLTYCVQELNLSDIDSAELSKIKLDNKCGLQPTTPESPASEKVAVTAPPATGLGRTAFAEGISSMSWLLLGGAGVSLGLAVLYYFRRRTRITA